jgi:hypothetical protein
MVEPRLFGVVSMYNTLQLEPCAVSHVVEMDEKIFSRRLSGRTTATNCTKMVQ